MTTTDCRCSRHLAHAFISPEDHLLNNMDTFTTTKSTGKSLLDESVAKKALVLPGDCLLRHEKDLIASSGTYLKNGYIFSSVAGRLDVELIVETLEEQPEVEGQTSDEATTEKQITKRVVRVLRPGSKVVPFPEAGSIVTCRVQRIKASMVSVSIHAIEDYTLKAPFSGVIKTEDIRDYSKATIQPIRCFRPGDIVLARVFAHGEKHEFLLTTAAPELGVIIATNEWGEPMIPISLNEMLCPRTYTKEPRKVAMIDMIA